MDLRYLNRGSPTRYRDLNGWHKRLLGAVPSGQSVPRCTFRRVHIHRPNFTTAFHNMSVSTNLPGNDNPTPSNSYVFTVYGTNDAFTLSGGEHIILANYSSNNANQIFRCDRVASTNRLGFVNAPTNRRILRNQFEDIRARPQGNPSVWESFSFEPLRGGGFRMTSMIGNVSSALRRIDEPGKHLERANLWFSFSTVM